MAILSWGKCKIYYAQSTNGAVAEEATWTPLDTPKEDTTKLTPTAGTEKKATEEGGDLVDVRYSKNTYVLETELFVKKGVNAPFTDEDGIVSGEYGIRVVPEDTTTEGILIDRSTVRVDLSYSTSDGKLLKHTFSCLKPASGNTVKPYTAG